MKKKLLLIFCCCVSLLPAQVSPFNALRVSDTLGGNYSFLVSGHFHGSSANISGFPAASLLSNLDLINQSGSAFMVCTGDMFLDVSRDIPQYKKSLFQKLRLPLFNVVGNHDLRKNVYEENFGGTWSAFDRSSEKFIFLDTEKDDGSIVDGQWAFFSDAVKQAARNRAIKNIFIFSHRPIWSENNEKLSKVFEGNTRSASINNFETQILPLLKTLDGKKKIYWISGSLGGNAPASFFYYPDPSGIVYIQTAIRNLPRDGMLKVRAVNGQISFETISFTTQPMPRLETCGLDMWKEHPDENPFFWNLVPLYIKQMLFHRYFWYGIGYSVLLYLLLYLVRSIKRKKIA